MTPRPPTRRPVPSAQQRDHLCTAAGVRGGEPRGGRAPARQQLHFNSALRPFDFDLPASLTSQLSGCWVLADERGPP
ncbi:hypothetical protein E2C01_086643 [Portunus trituberculatus]|uniref:Uncharacterized protein n=1 Tax=Portunus trituberculatus TaxID=210409 RepID=A0A5B7JE13_PORTR|nr:hypothetical protein [Portunus trituberculatus]